MQALPARSPKPYFSSSDLFMVDTLRVPTLSASVTSLVQQGLA
ncbi:hypothetical protein [Hymenobacter metallicola]|nr:hypothetical protein [Hymenobacter metallicola]